MSLPGLEVPARVAALSVLLGPLFRVWRAMDCPRDVGSACDVDIFGVVINGGERITSTTTSPLDKLWEELDPITPDCPEAVTEIGDMAVVGRGKLISVCPASSSQRHQHDPRAPNGISPSPASESAMELAVLGGAAQLPPLMSDEPNDKSEDANEFLLGSTRSRSCCTFTLEFKPITSTIEFLRR